MGLKEANEFLASLPAGQRRRSVVKRWHTALDNYTPVREYANGHAVSFTLPTTSQIGYVLFGIEKLTLPSESVYVVQDADTLAMVPVAWHGATDEFGSRVVLHPYPTEGIVTLGPKRSYHIKLTDIK